jgi:hypothetical protein
MGAASAPWADGLEHINVRLFLSMFYRCESFCGSDVPSPLFRSAINE